MKLRTALLSLIAVFSISISHAEVPDNQLRYVVIKDLAKTYLTEKEYQEAYDTGTRAVERRYPFAYAMSETKLETVMNNVCDQAEDEFALYNLTLLNNKYPSAQEDHLTAKDRVQDILKGLSGWEFNCYPKRHIYKRED